MFNQGSNLQIDFDKQIMGQKLTRIFQSIILLVLKKCKISQLNDALHINMLNITKSNSIEYFFINHILQLRIVVTIFFLFTSAFCFTQMACADASTEYINIDDIAAIYKDVNGNMTIDSLLSNKVPFVKVKQHTNYGLSWSAYWLKFCIQNPTNESISRQLAFESTIIDSITIYESVAGAVSQSTLIGEGMDFKDRACKNIRPVHNIVLKPHQSYTYYIRGKSVGQPVNLTAKLLSPTSYERWNYVKLFFTGSCYGIVFIILLLNLSFFITTSETLYVNFTLQVFCSWLCIIYFDGYIHKYIFPASQYWSNQSIAIFMSLTFVFSNLSVSEYFNLKKLAPFEDKTSKVLTIIIIGLLAISFWHPYGFFTYICCMIAVTSLVALLLFKSILIVKKQGFTTYFYGLIATVNLIIFGSLYQLFIAGVVPDVFITQHAMHLAVVGQALFMALAVNDKFKHIKDENNKYQERLVMALNEYAQNLTNNIENERQRLANDLHDSLGQNLLSVRNQILLIKKRKQIAPEANEQLDILSQAISGTLEEVRTISYNLRPPILNTLGLTAAINSLVENIKATTDLNVYIDFSIVIDGFIKKDLEINVYRILQECFNNVIKHANASTVSLTITQENKILFTFKDDGIGFDEQSAIKGQGLIGIKERIALLGGNLDIDSQIHQGTCITFSLPILPTSKSLVP
jgi:two-component system, sensor histidine kinase LadS